ncbi:hypothetical protein Tco_0800393 [Tanacetum coccineum]|uniref:Uncharacterized protein n=1 Tax=Tanacetum coccineum TaxID=301880 RepID=A0ABQ4ZTY8_9ASTR
MGDEHLDTIPATESDEVIKSSVEDLVPIPSESEGIPDKMCDVPLCENTTPLNALNEHSEIVVNSDDDNSSSDDDSPYGEDIDYVDASPPDVEIVSLEVVEIVDPEAERIDDDILLTIKRTNTSLPDPGDLTSIDPGIRKNVSTTNVNLPLEDDQSSLFAYVVWIFLAFLTYPVDFPVCEDSQVSTRVSHPQLHVGNPEGGLGNGVGLSNTKNIGRWCDILLGERGLVFNELKEGVKKTTLEMILEKYVTITRGNYILGNDGEKIVEKSVLKLKGKISVFPVSPTGTASELFKRECIGSVAKWEDLTEKLFTKFYPHSRIGKREVCTNVKSDPDKFKFARWLASKFQNHETMDWHTKNTLWAYWRKGGDEKVMSYKEIPKDVNSPEEDEIAQIFRIDTDLFDFESPLYQAFKELNYPYSMDGDGLTDGTHEFKTNEECKDDWIYK